MAAIALAYYFLNKADPDCGTTFSWMTKAMGPWWGWQGGWAIVVADVLVMPNLAQIASVYTFSMFGNDDPSKWPVLIVGLTWIVLMTVICYIGIELNALTQRILLAFEFIVLVAFAVIALIKVYAGHPVGSVHPQASWFNPLDIKGGLSALNGGLLLAIFIYWGWDSGVSVNEETENPSEAPGRAALVSTVVLVLIYLLVTTAAQAFGGLHNLTTNPRRCVLAARQGRIRQWSRQVPDAGDPVLGVLFHTDDDPADSSHDAVDGPGRGDPEAVPGRSTRAS